MQYAVTVIIDADNLKSAVSKVPDEIGEVISAVPRPQVQTGGKILTQQPQKTNLSSE